MDQVFSQKAALIARHTFNTPDEVVNILDTSCRPDAAGERARKQAKIHKVKAMAYKLDEVAGWKKWLQVVGVKIKGMRLLEHFVGQKVASIQTVPSWRCSGLPYEPKKRPGINPCSFGKEATNHLSTMGDQPCRGGGQNGNGFIAGSHL